MNPRSQQRTQACGSREAAVRLEHAAKFYEVAGLVETEADSLESSASVSAALAVLAGIASADAACCAALARRSRGQDHRRQGRPATPFRARSRAGRPRPPAGRSWRR
jgi:hypothetical protein